MTLDLPSPHVQNKFKGLHANPAPRVDAATSLFVFFGCFVSLTSISLLQKTGQEIFQKEFPYFIGSFGALSTLVFGAPQVRYIRLWQYFLRT